VVRRLDLIAAAAVSCPVRAPFLPVSRPLGFRSPRGAIAT
jgi:hypothetical protein